MAKIIATGTYMGTPITIEVTVENEALVVAMGGCRVAELEEDLRYFISRQHPMRGTYFPKLNSLFAAYYALQTTFFDQLEDITVEGDIAESDLEREILASDFFSFE